MQNPLVRYSARFVYPAVIGLLVVVAGVAQNHLGSEAVVKAVQAEEVRIFREHFHAEHRRLKADLGNRDEVALRRRILGLALHEGVVDAWLVDPRGQVVASLARVQIHQPLEKVLAPATGATRRLALQLQGKGSDQLEIVKISEETSLLASVGVGDGHILLVKLSYAHALARRQYERRWDLFAYTTIAVAMVVFLTLLMHFLLFKRTFQLTAALERVAFGQLEVPIAFEGSDELARIATAASAMAATLQQQIEQLDSLRDIIDRSPVVAMTWRNEPGWPVAFVSDSVRQWGYAPEEFLGGKFVYANLIHGGDLPRVAQEAAEHFANGPDEFRQEYRLRRADGSWMWVEDRTCLSRDSQGVVIRITGILLDTSERKAIEEAFVGHSRSLAIAIAATGLGTFEIDMQTGAAVTNAEYCEQLGYDPQTFQETMDRWVSSIHPDDGLRMAAKRQAMMAGTSQTDLVDLRVRRADGSWVWLERRIEVTERDAQGRPTKVVGTSLDIQSRKQAEAQLAREVRRSEVLLRLPELAESLREKAFFQRVLDFAEELTDSRIGFMHFVHDAGQSIELAAWSSRTVGEYCDASDDNYYPATQAGIWVDALRQREAVIVNDYANHPFKRGLPEGHSHLERLVTVPVLEADQVVMVAGLGNKVGLYDEADVTTLRLLTQAAFRLAQRRRALLQITRFHRIMARSTLEIYLLNTTTGRFVEVNDGAITNLGYSLDELLQMGLEDIADTSSSDALMGYLELLRHGDDASQPFAAQHRRKNGTTYPVELHVELTDDVPPLVLLVSLDVSLRVAMEAENRKLALVVDQSPESIVVTDMDGTIEYVNPAFERISGYRYDELIGRNPRVLQSGRTPATTMTQMWQALRAGDVWRGQFINRRKDGSDYFEQAFVGPLRQADGRITHYLAIKEDVTEKLALASELERHRDHLEELVRARTAELAEARDRAEAGIRAKDAFLANMSHEIRTPLNAILGMTYLLLRADLPADSHRRLLRISDAGRHLLSLINDILDLSRIDAGKVTLEQAPVDVAAIVQDVVYRFEDQAAQKGLKLTVDADPLPEGLVGDTTRLSQSLVNLVGNAVKFTAEGQVELRVRLLSANPASAQLRFEIEDTGIGIASEDLARLFRPFEQADSSTTRKHGGSGLGLAITLQLVELMGGKMDVQTRVGSGTVFAFTIEFSRIDGRGHGEGGLGQLETGSVAVAVAGKRVLLAEDDLVNQEVALGLLQHMGLVAEAAANGVQAVAMFKAAPFDLVLMDIQMPEMDGFAATKALRSWPGGARVPILALTANASPEDRARCLASGMDDLVSKPVDPDQFCDTLAKWLRQPAAPRQDLPAPPVALAEQMEDLRAAMAKVGDPEWQGGLTRVRGNVGLYIRLLRAFSREHHSDLAGLDSQQTGGTGDGLRHLAHRLRGAAATLGLMRLSSAAEALEVHLNKADFESPQSQLERAALSAAAMQQLLLVVGAVAEMADSTSMTAAPEWPTIQVAALLEKMELLLTAHDAEVVRLFHNSSEQLTCLPGPKLAELQQLIDRFAFREALEVVRHLRLVLGPVEGIRPA